MSGAHDGLTLEGLAQILRDHMDGTAVKFDEVRAQFAEVGLRIDDLRREVAGVAGMVRDLSQIVLRQVEEIAEHRRLHEEHRQTIRQIFARMEQHDARNEQHDARMAEHDARFEAISRDIRRILDAMERRGGDGGRGEG
jgi:methyl-accepting chemotaxis protein